MLLAGALSGCMQSGTITEEADLESSTDGIPSRQPLTRAPLEIDPRILADREFNEAPMLKEMVRKGELPPVSERLPENPLVVAPLEEIGRYGGEIRRALKSDVSDETGITKTLNDSITGYERPFANSIQPNLAERWEFKDEGRTAIFYLRKGVRWSDGHPFTADDVLFWYYDMAFDANARTVALFPSIWLVDGKPAKMEKIDDHTLKVSAHKPLGRVLHAFAFDDFAAPKHIYARYHPRHNPDATYEEFRERTNQSLLVLEPGIPRVSAWVPKEWIRGQRAIFERNPYYWKVDTVGNQLPYADRLIFTIVEKPEIMLLKFSNGEIDLFGRNSTVNMIETLRAGERRGVYELRISGPKGPVALYVNWDAPEPSLRKAFRTLNVRIALSLAINRIEMKEILFHGYMEPCGFSLSPISPYYTEEAYKKYSQYDPVKAALLLEEAGYTDSDGDGYRELLDGSRFEMNLDVVSTAGKDDFSQLIMDYWAAIGLKLHLNSGREEIIYPRRLNGEFDVYQSGVNSPSDPMGRPNAWAIMTAQTPWWHRNASEEGPEWLLESTRILHEAMTTIDPDRLRELMTRFRDLMTDNIPVIVIGAPYHLWGAHTRMGNVPQDLTLGDTYRGWSRPVFHEQVFVRQ